LRNKHGVRGGRGWSDRSAGLKNKDRGLAVWEEGRADKSVVEVQPRGYVAWEKLPRSGRAEVRRSRRGVQTKGPLLTRKMVKCEGISETDAWRHVFRRTNRGHTGGGRTLKFIQTVMYRNCETKKTSLQTRGDWTKQKKTTTQKSREDAPRRKINTGTHGGEKTAKHNTSGETNTREKKKRRKKKGGGGGGLWPRLVRGRVNVFQTVTLTKKGGGQGGGQALFPSEKTNRLSSLLK